jgi:hypothetical protein
MSFWYLGSPYSKYPAGTHQAFVVACQETARLVRAGVPVFSPIAHSHGIAEHGGIDPVDHTIWLPADQPFMAAARGIIVLKLDGWFKSVGLFNEIGYFVLHGKPVVYMVPGEIPPELLP